jgi:hypothetical protein
MKKWWYLIVFFSLSTSLFAKHHKHHSSEEEKKPQEKSSEKKEKSMEDRWNDWKRDPYSSSDEKSSSKSHGSSSGNSQKGKDEDKDFYHWDFKKNWEDSDEFSFEDSPDGKKVGPDTYERTLFKNKNNEMNVRAKKDEKDGFDFSFSHEWSSD